MTSLKYILFDISISSQPTSFITSCFDIRSSVCGFINIADLKVYLFSMICSWGMIQSLLPWKTISEYLSFILLNVILICIWEIVLKQFFLWMHILVWLVVQRKPLLIVFSWDTFSLTTDRATTNIHNCCEVELHMLPWRLQRYTKPPRQCFIQTI